MTEAQAKRQRVRVTPLGWLILILLPWAIVGIGALWVMIFMAVIKYALNPAMNQIEAWRDAATSPMSQQLWAVGPVVFLVVAFIAALFGLMKVYGWATSGEVLRPFRERMKRLVHSGFQTVDHDET
ncbi:MAG: hypothetical protein AAF823_10220 [Planctomycetota bacterium]